MKGNALKGRTFSSLADQNQHLQTWEATVADTRIHGTTRRQVKEVFEQAEKPALLTTPDSRFDLFQEALRSVHRDGHVEIKGAYYSVPPEFLGQRAWARWDGRTVRLLDQKMRPIALHAQRPPGTFSTESGHILPEKISGVERGTAWMLRRVESIGAHATQWAQSMLNHRGIEGCRVLMGLLSLANSHRRDQIELPNEVPGQQQRPDVAAHPRQRRIQPGERAHQLLELARRLALATATHRTTESTRYPAELRSGQGLSGG